MSALNLEAPKNTVLYMYNTRSQCRDSVYGCPNQKNRRSTGIHVSKKKEVYEYRKESYLKKTMNKKRRTGMHGNHLRSLPF